MAEDIRDQRYMDNAAEDELIAARLRERRDIGRHRALRKRKRTILLIALAFVLLASMCGRDIVKLRAENRALKKQQIALQKERDELKEELRNTSKQEYIRDQARRQLRLLNPGEILFTFEDDENAAKDAKTDEQ